MQLCLAFCAVLTSSALLMFCMNASLLELNRIVINLFRQIFYRWKSKFIEIGWTDSELTDIHKRVRSSCAYPQWKKWAAMPFQSSVMTLVENVQSVINKYKRYSTAKTLNGRGKKRKVSPKLARKVCREVNNNSRITIKALIETLDQTGTKVPWYTPERDFLHNRGGLHGCKPRRCCYSGRNIWRHTCPLPNVIWSEFSVFEQRMSSG